jgi:ribosomal protein S12 methylthiotransferase accessory factor
MKVLNLVEPVRRPLEEMVKAGRRLVSTRTGVIKAVTELPIEQDDPLVFSFGTEMADTRRYSATQCSNRSGGAAISQGEAFLAAIGEAVERYCSNFYVRSELILSRYVDMASDTVAPERFALFSDQQYRKADFPFQRFTESSRLYWTWAYSLVDRRPKLVPACFTYLPYEITEDEALIGPSISTGLSCACSLAEAILTGIYECIERDAFTIMWLNRLRMPMVDIGAGSREIVRLFRDKFALSNIHYCICDITSDLKVPTFYCLARGNSAVGILPCVGTATRLNAEKAVAKVLVESAQGRPYLRYVLRKDEDWDCGEGFSGVRDFDDHGRLYSSRPDLIPQLLFVEGPSSRSAEDLLNLSSGTVLGDIQFCVDALAEKGFDVLVVDLTTRDVEEVGFRVVKVIIPGLQPLHGDHRFPFLGGRRLYEVPRLLGYTAQDTEEEGLNPWPHPFP